MTSAAIDPPSSASERTAGRRSDALGRDVARAGGNPRWPARDTHADALEDLRETETEVVEVRVADDEGHGRRPSDRTSGTLPRVVDDGDVLTAGGVTAGIDLALWILEREFDRTLAEEVATTPEYDRGEVHRA